jgi:hypothetical protein
MKSMEAATCATPPSGGVGQVPFHCPLAGVRERPWFGALFFLRLVDCVEAYIIGGEKVRVIFDYFPKRSQPAYAKNHLPILFQESENERRQL